MVVLHRRVGQHPPDRHREVQLDDVSGSPSALDPCVPTLQIEGQRATIYLEGRRLRTRVREAVQLSRHDLAARPPRDPHVQRERNLTLRLDHETDPPLPGIARLLPQACGNAGDLDAGVAVCEKIHIERT